LSETAGFLQGGAHYLPVKWQELSMVDCTEAGQNAVLIWTYQVSFSTAISVSS